MTQETAHKTPPVCVGEIVIARSSDKPSKRDYFISIGGYIVFIQGNDAKIAGKLIKARITEVTRNYGRCKHLEYIKEA